MGLHLRTREVGITDRDKQLHPTISVGGNYLSLPLIYAYGTRVLICHQKGLVY